MSEYAPTTGEVRRRYAYARSAGHKNQSAVAEFDRWLAAHDAEKRAEWEAERRAPVHEEGERALEALKARLTVARLGKSAFREADKDLVAMESARAALSATLAALAEQGTEEPEWEYGWVSRYPSGEQASESDSGNTREFAERAVAKNREYWPGQQNAPLEYLLSKRTKAVPAGPWVPVEQEGESDA